MNLPSQNSSSIQPMFEDIIYSLGTKPRYPYGLGFIIEVVVYIENLFSSL